MLLVFLSLTWRHTSFMSIAAAAKEIDLRCSLLTPKTIRAILFLRYLHVSAFLIGKYVHATVFQFSALRMKNFTIVCCLKIRVRSFFYFQMTFCYGFNFNISAESNHFYSFEAHHFVPVILDPRWKRTGSYKFSSVIVSGSQWVTQLVS